MIPGTGRARGLLLAALCLAGPASGDVAPCPERERRPLCPPPRLAPVEEVLDARLHVAWEDPHGAQARGYELERRRADGSVPGPWSTVAGSGGDPTAREDRGLEPGRYEYRVRGRYAAADGPGQAWSDWSEPGAFVLHAGCEGAGPPPAGLDVVRAVDADADGRLTGSDLEQALRRCAQLGGCVLELLPDTYDDVALLLYDGDRAACTPERSACLTLGFPRGLVIQGHGSRSVLRSPLWSPPYRPVPVVELWKRPDIRIWLRNLVLDGRKLEQRGPRPGRNDSNTWWHYGFAVWNQWGDHQQRNRGGCIHGVTARNLMLRGVSLADVADWVVEDSNVEDIGCLDGLTPCPALAIPDAFSRGYQSAGYGILIGWYADDVQIRRNRIRRVTKYSIGLKHGSDGSETSIRRPQVLDNQILEAGSIGIFLSGVAEGIFRGNTIDSTHVHDPEPAHATYNNTFAVSCAERVERTSVLENTILDSAGISINWQCQGTGNLVAGNRISGSCREKNPTTCVPGRPRECYELSDIRVPRNARGSLRLVDNEVLDSGCGTPLEASSPDLELEIEGCRFTAGPHLSRPVRLLDGRVQVGRGTRFEGVALELGRAASGVVSPTVRVTGGVRPAYRKDPASQVLVCPEQARACAARCAASDAPAWCAE